jgi:uncharacterized RDD family membrane protein YckC
MACPVCGKPSPCLHERQRSAVLVSPENETEPGSARSETPVRPAASNLLSALPDQPWRQEVISRVQQHRARRRKRFDSSATLEFDFKEADSQAQSPQEEQPSAPALEPPKIIQFPRTRALAVEPVRLPQPAELPEDLELAEPVLDTPRILDAPEPPPEQLDLIPTFADIQLEEAEQIRHPAEVELPPQPAPLSYRLFAVLVDLTVVLLASAVFAMGFVIFGKGLPQPRFMLLCSLLVCASLWLVYQYLFLVYSTGTPGMQLAGLELCTFKGEPVPLSMRRWRALASMLSALAVGLGFAWAFVDEDTLGWHDRITQTHLRTAA